MASLNLIDSHSKHITLFPHFFSLPLSSSQPDAAIIITSCVFEKGTIVHRTLFFRLFKKYTFFLADFHIKLHFLIFFHFHLHVVILAYIIEVKLSFTCAEKKERVKVVQSTSSNKNEETTKLPYFSCNFHPFSSTNYA